MATAPESSANNNTPSSPAAKADGFTAVASAASAAAGVTVSSPQSRRSLQAPWAQVVRGGEPEVVSVSSPRSPSPLASAAGVSPEKISLSDDCSTQKPSPEICTSGDLPESSDSNDGNVGKPKKPAWNKPVNGVVEAVSVMGGAVSWPALSESTRPSPKSSTDSPKPIPDGSASVSQGPIISQSPQKQANVNANTNSNANPTTPVRQRSMKYKGSSSSGGAGSGPGGGAFIRTPPPPPPPLPPPFPVMHYPPPVLEPPVRGSRPVGGGFPSQPHGTNDHSPHRNHGRKGNFGGRPRGDGSYHNNHGGRRDQDRRDIHMAPQFAPPPHAPFMRPPPPGSGPFLPPPPMRPFVAPMGFDMGQFFFVPPLNPEPYSGVPIISQAPQLPPHLPLMDPNLPPSLINQIEYYFSDANLVKDDFLRLNMDEEGWVPIKLIANFPRVKSMTDKVQSDNVQFILYCLRASTFVELQDEKVRRRDGWRKWTHTSGQLTADSGSSTPVASTDGGLTASLQNVSLNESATNIISATEVTDAQLEVAPGGLSDESTNQSKPAQEEGSADAEVISTNHA